MGQKNESKGMEMTVMIISKVLLLPQDASILMMYIIHINILICTNGSLYLV
jgi:hypothetical protein